MTAAHRVGYIGNFKRSFCTEVHVRASLESLGHSVVSWQENEVDWRTLAAQAVDEGVDFVMWTRTWHLPSTNGTTWETQLATLAELERRGIPTVGYHLDRWFGLDREHQVRDEPFFRCHPGDQRVEAASVVAVSRRWYTGDMVRITAGGHHLSATPNHPVLTRRGWVPIGLLREGDDLVTDGRREGARLGGPQVEHAPPTIEEVFGAGREMPDGLAVRRERRRGVPMDFHGDGTDGDVDVVWPDDPLVFGREILQPGEDLGLLLAVAREVHWTKPGAHVLAVSDLDESRCLSAASNRDTGLGKDAQYHGPTDSLLSRDRLGRQPGLVGGNRGVPDRVAVSAGRPGSALAAGHTPGPHRHAVGDETLTDAAGRTPSEGCECSKAFACLISMTKIDKIERSAFAGYVYNLSTHEGSYLAEGVVAHNCSVVCTADGGHEAEFAAAGVNHRWFPPGVWGAEAQQPGRVRDEWARDVGFVGSWERYHAEWGYRMELVQWLRTQFERHGQLLLMPRGGQPVRGQDLNDLYASVKVVVGDSCLAGGSVRYWSDRVPETLGRGGFLIHPWVEGIEEHYTDGEHLALYELGDWGALRNIINVYAHEHEERARVAAQGRAHVLEHHTYERRMADLIDMLHSGSIVGSPDTAAGRRRVFGKHRLSAVFDMRPDTTDALVVNEVWRLDTYELDPGQIVGRTVVDIGANVGAFTVWAATAGAHHVYAYEPEASNAEALAGNVHANQLDDVVTVVPAAVASTGRRLALLRGPDLAGTRTVEVGHLPKGADCVQATGIDRVMATAVAEGTALVVKIDCEGFEYDIVPAMADVLATGVIEAIVMEFHGAGMWGPEWGYEDGAFGKLVEVLAEHGRVRTLGRPSVGGTIWYTRY